MRNVFIAALLTLGMSFPAQAQVEGDAAAGEGKIATCIACHGRDGNAVMVENAAKIGGQNEAYLLKQLRDISSGARPVPVMAGIVAPLSEQDLADIAAWYASQDAPQGAAREDAVALGEQIYRAGLADIGVAACAACHLPTGSGIDGAGYPLLRGQDPNYTENQLRAFRSGQRANDDAQVMRSITERLRDEEISAVASYISGLRVQ